MRSPFLHVERSRSMPARWPDSGFRLPGRAPPNPPPPEPLPDPLDLVEVLRAAISVLHDRPVDLALPRQRVPPPEVRAERAAHRRAHRVLGRLQVQAALPAPPLVALHEGRDVRHGPPA